MLPLQVLRMLRILATRTPGEARIAPTIRAGSEYTRGQAKAGAAGAAAGYGAGGAAMYNQGEGYSVTITPEEAFALGLGDYRGDSFLPMDPNSPDVGRVASITRRLTPQQMDALELYQTMSRSNRNY